MVSTHMNEELMFFTLGALFAFFSTFNIKIMNLISISVLYIFILSNFKRNCTDNKQKLVTMVTFTEMCGLISSVLLEYLLFRRRPTILMSLVSRLSAIPLFLGAIYSLWAVASITKVVDKEVFLVFTGPYRYCRHPFYLGVSISVLSGCFYLCCYISASIVLFFIFLKMRERILKEENELNKIETYSDYKKRVGSGFFI